MLCVYSVSWTQGSSTLWALSLSYISSLLFVNRASQSYPAWLCTSSVAQGGLNLWSSCLSWELKACTIRPRTKYFFKIIVLTAFCNITTTQVSCALFSTVMRSWVADSIVRGKGSLTARQSTQQWIQSSSCPLAVLYTVVSQNIRACWMQRRKNRPALRKVRTKWEQKQATEILLTSPIGCINKPNKAKLT